jgi:hypothetical protein
MPARKPAPERLVRTEQDGAVYALVDLLIARPEVGPTKETLIRAGHVIPAEFQHNPRRRKP